MIHFTRIYCVSEEMKKKKRIEKKLYTRLFVQHVYANGHAYAKMKLSNRDKSTVADQIIYEFNNLHVIKYYFPSLFFFFY